MKDKLNPMTIEEAIAHDLAIIREMFPDDEMDTRTDEEIDEELWQEELIRRRKYIDPELEWEFLK